MSLIGGIKKSCPWWVKASVARLKRTGIVLMYHRINDGQNDPYHLNVSPKNFEEQIRVIKKYGKTVQMREIGEGLNKFDLKKDQIALTFDDGISDNFHNAKPVLEKHGIPATFYIPSCSMENQQESWWDKLARILDVPNLPKLFEISLNNVQYRWEIDSNSQEGSFTTDSLPPLNCVVSVKQFNVYIWSLIKLLAYDQQNELVDKVEQWAGSTSSQKAYLPMSLNELKVMADSDLFEIGAHTVHHPWLSAWPVKEQEKEISAGKQKLEQWLNKEITSFAYPFGNYSQETPDILERLGFQNACTVVEKPIMRNMCRYLLPRYMVFNWNGEKFEQNLRVWLTERE